MNCALPHPAPRVVTLAHGGGGRLSQQLIDRVFAPAFGLRPDALHDGAELGADGLVLATDAHVVRPLFFPGGDIGTLAAHGSCNDLAMCGAEPLWLATTFILEEGLELDALERIAASLARAAAESGARVVTGDTKVVEKSRGDGLHLSVAAVGRRRLARPVGAADVAPGDVLILSGDVGRHGCAVLGAREGLEFSPPIHSDCAPLWPLVRAWIAAGVAPTWMRDCTRGGLATVLAELASARGLEVELEEAAVPVRPEVRGACELLGLDPLYVANEGCFVACVPATDADRALAVLRAAAPAREARVVGRVGARESARVVARQTYGTSRVLDRLAGEQLPRIC